MIAVVAAVREEVRDYLARGSFDSAKEVDGVRIHQSPSLPEVAVVVGGIGKERAVAATLLAIEMLRPDMIISAGFAGGVQPGLECGDLVVCDAVWHVKGPPNAWSLDSAESISVAQSGIAQQLTADLHRQGHRCLRGDCLTVPSVVVGHAEKQRIGIEFPVSIIDMESFWVASTSARCGVPHAVVRSVLDPVTQSLPQFAGKVAAIGGSGRWYHTFKYLLMRPGEVPGLIALAAQARVAGASLASLLGAWESAGRHPNVV